MMKKTIKFEEINAMNIDEFAEWFSKNCSHDTDPCITWWNDTYCKNCGDSDDSNVEFKYSWCELNGNCKFFQNMDHVPNPVEMVKLWLESEA